MNSVILFHSAPSIIFLLILVCIYWASPNKFRPIILVISSFIFYMSWSWKFTLLLVASILINHIFLKNVHKNKIILWLAISYNLLILGIFKYANFFLENLYTLLNAFGLHTPTSTLQLILPLGISFYTFQIMGYIIDVYRNKIKPHNLITTAAFISFFPQLIAGPVERAKDLIPQFYNKKTLNCETILSGIDLFVWGLIKKLVIADNLRILVDLIFSHNNASTGLIILGSIGFAVQLYADFSGYVDMARGTAKMLGITLVKNFNFPIFASSPGNYWQRWHISLSNWFKTYLFNPVMGTKFTHIKFIYTILLTWFLIGLWHGASWEMIVFGLYWGIMTILFTYCFYKIKLHNVIANILMIPIILIGFFLFRIDNLSYISDYISIEALISTTTQIPIITFSASYIIFYSIFLLISGLFHILILNKKQETQLKQILRPVFYGIAYVILLIFTSPLTGDYIYFQF